MYTSHCCAYTVYLRESNSIRREEYYMYLIIGPTRGACFLLLWLCRSCLSAARLHKVLYFFTYFLLYSHPHYCLVAILNIFHTHFNVDCSHGHTFYELLPDVPITEVAKEPRGISISRCPTMRIVIYLKHVPLYSSLTLNIAAFSKRK